jgi:hypothetical protein
MAFYNRVAVLAVVVLACFLLSRLFHSSDRTLETPIEPTNSISSSVAVSLNSSSVVAPSVKSAVTSSSKSSASKSKKSSTSSKTSPKAPAAGAAPVATVDMKAVNVSFIESFPNDFIIRIKKIIRSKKDIVSLAKFYTEHNLSFAKTVNILQPNNSTSTFTFNSNSNITTTQLKTIVALSADSAPVESPQAIGVYSVAWSREWYKDNYIVAKPGYAATFLELAKQIAKVKDYVDGNGGNLSAIRYHTYTSHCKLIKSLGDPNVLPIPVVLTYKLNPDMGHYSSDTVGKTCIRSSSRDSRGQCKEIMDLGAYLRRCRQKIENLVDVLNNPKLLLLLTNQQQSFTHPKILSLPLGVSASVAAKISILLSEMKDPPERPIFIAISNFNGYYSNMVSCLLALDDFTLIGCVFDR